MIRGIRILAGDEGAAPLHSRAMRPIRTLFCLAAFLLFSLAKSFALTALVGGRLIDGFGGPPLANSVILIEGERINAIGQVGTLAVPAGAEVISTEGMDVLPAFGSAMSTP
jgi:hypothetical protein